jgi:hypothetical protein
MNFYCLTFSKRFGQFAGNTDTSACGYWFEVFFPKLLIVDNNLDVIDGGAVVEGDKAHVFITAAGSYPAFYVYISAKVSPFEGGGNYSSGHLFYTN